jgi:hypothetical protein
LAGAGAVSGVAVAVEADHALSQHRCMCPRYVCTPRAQWQAEHLTRNSHVGLIPSPAATKLLDASHTHQWRALGSGHTRLLPALQQPLDSRPCCHCYSQILTPKGNHSWMTSARWWDRRSTYSAWVALSGKERLNALLGDTWLGNRAAAGNEWTQSYLFHPIRGEEAVTFTSHYI